MAKLLKITAYLIPVVVLMFVPFFMGVGMQSSKDDTSGQKSADLIYAVLQADRAAYVRLIDKQGVMPEQNASAMPPHLFENSTVDHLDIAEGLQYSVQSLWAINQQNFPQSDKEREGLIYILKNPGKNYYTTVEADGVKYFMAVYPDNAISPACVACHNANKNSPKKDFQVGDLMGGIVVRIPLSRG